MPLGFHRSSNRSKQKLDDPSASSSAIQGLQGTATPSSDFTSGTDDEAVEARSTTQQQPNAYPQSQIQTTNPQPHDYAAASLGSRAAPAPVDRTSFQQSANSPARSQSTRHTSPYLPQEQYPQAANSVDDLTLRHQQQQQQQLELQQQQQNQQNQQNQHQNQHQHQLQHQRLPPLQKAPAEHRKSRNLLDRIRLSRAPAEQKATASPPQASYNNNNNNNNTSTVARSPSKRTENPPLIRTSQQGNSLDTQQRLDWQAAHASDSRSTLPSPQEGAEDDSGLDPYLITKSEQDSPQTVIAEQGLPHTIRSVPNADPPQFLSSEEAARQQLFHTQAHNRQHSFGQQAQQPSFELPPQNQYEYPQPLHTQPLSTNPDSLGIIHHQYQHQQQQNPETVSQLSYDSPVDQGGREEQARPVSRQSNGQSGGNTPVRQDYPNRTTSIQAPRPLSQYNQMAPPPTGASQPSRRNDPKQALQGAQAPSDPRTEGAPPGYQPRGFPPGGNSTPTAGPGQSPIPPIVGSNPQGPNYRGGPPQREQYVPSGGGEQGRSTPPPAAERDVNDAYKELLQKYKKVKGLYFDKTSQVEQLQNTLANQRLSQSRTSLDDNEYMTRFQRLDGATTNLAFNIRKNWRTIPNWLAPYVNQDAMKIGKQEMTAVGRACISRFLVDEIFNRSFHPGLESELSHHLKLIEQNIRRFSPAFNSQEESDALTGKIVLWRLATLEGLKDVLTSPESEECRREFSTVATSNLTANLINYLGEPVPEGIQDSAHMIIELAVSIAANIPIESRDISIIYPMPGDFFTPNFMKVESGVPSLENPVLDTSTDADAASTGSGDKDEASSKEGEKENNKLRKEKPKTGMLQAMMGGGQGQKIKSAPAQQQQEVEPKKEDAPPKVRFAGFVGVEVRGRQMLGKAPVWTV